MSDHEGGHPIADFYERARNRWVGSDPGLLRLRMAIRTTAALGCSLAALFVLTRATGQPLTVALLGVVITMVAARSVNEPDPRQQRITMALLPVPAAASITAAALLASRPLAADIAFVVVVFAAVYIRRFGARGRALGMVAFMAYFFTLYLRARLSELPWMIGAVAVGTVCTFLMSSYVLPDRPERVLDATVRALRARMAIVVDTAAEALRTGRLDDRRRRRLGRRTNQLNETALMVLSQIEDKANPGDLWPGVTAEQLTPWLFDAELSVGWVATSGRQAAAVAAEIPDDTRMALIAALSQLARAIRLPEPPGLRQAASQAQSILDRVPVDTGDRAAAAVRRVALAIINAAGATADVRALVERAGTGALPVAAARDEAAAAPATPAAGDSGQRPTGLLPTTRQAIQVAVAASFAIVAGELVSPARWYWAVIAAFVIFAGTNSWGETLTKGWQRLVGTILGVPCGILVATLFAGNTLGSLAMIFVCLFCAFYCMTVTYSLMTFWITTMLALLYGLLGELSFGVLLVRIEETALGAVIGVAAAVLVLPTNTRTAIRHDTRGFLTALAALIDTCAGVGDPQIGRDRAGKRRRTLKAHAHPAPQPQRVGVGDVAAAEQHPATRRQLQTIAQAQQGGLARTRRPEHRRHALARNGRRQPVQRADTAPLDDDVEEFEHRLYCGHRPILPHRAPAQRRVNQVVAPRESVRTLARRLRHSPRLRLQLTHAYEI